jgi:hypothetical protein
MGSALCFPVESIVFWALAVATCYEYLNSGGYDAGDPRKEIYTFGDDIIVPQEYASVVMDQLERFWLIFNKEKSFVRGPFRESCGCDAFLGTDVTPIKIKTLQPQELSHTESIVAWVDYANGFAQREMWGTSEYIFEHLHSIGLDKDYLPICSEDIGCLRKWSPYQERPGEGLTLELDRAPKLKIRKLPENQKRFQIYQQYRPFFQGATLKAWTVETVNKPIVFNDGSGLYDWFRAREGMIHPRVTPILTFILKPMVYKPEVDDEGRRVYRLWVQPMEDITRRLVERNSGFQFLRRKSGGIVQTSVITSIGSEVLRVEPVTQLLKRKRIILT